MNGVKRLRPKNRRCSRRLKHSRSEEHTSELQSLTNLVCRLLLEKKNTIDAGLQHDVERTASDRLTTVPADIRDSPDLDDNARAIQARLQFPTRLQIATAQVNTPK